MIVDVHTHLWDRTESLGPSLAARINQRLARRPWERMNVCVSSLTQAMETVDAAFILGMVSKRLEADIPASLIARYVSQDPSKFVGFAGVDPTADDYRDRLNEAVSLKLAGLTISPAAQGFHPTHSRAMRVYEFAVEHKMPIIIDAASYQVAQASMEFGQPHLLDEVAREFPELRMVIGQVGHPWTDATLALIGKHAHLYADISSLAARPLQHYQVLQAASQQDVIHRLLLGSGFPFATPEQVMASLYNVNGLVRGTLMPSIPRQELKNIVQRDAFECLGIKPLVPQSTPRRRVNNESELQNTSPADALLNQGLPQGEDVKDGQDNAGKTTGSTTGSAVSGTEGASPSTGRPSSKDASSRRP